jgi:thiamine pyrophosphate-dependent acetolactate synthase large subunit-like protein
VAVTGDGGFGQYLGELTTAVKYGMNITHVLLNNSQLGKISKEQRASQYAVWQTSLHNPDFCAYARSCGALGIHVTRADELDDALARALAHDGPVLVEVVTDPELV